VETITTADGRTVGYEVVGDPDGTPVLWQHGTGDSRLWKHSVYGRWQEFLSAIV
jgi:hypothetical protein